MCNCTSYNNADTKPLRSKNTRMPSKVSNYRNVDDLKVMPLKNSIANFGLGYSLSSPEPGFRNVLSQADCSKLYSPLSQEYIDCIKHGGSAGSVYGPQPEPEKEGFFGKLAGFIDKFINYGKGGAQSPSGSPVVLPVPQEKDYTGWYVAGAITLVAVIAVVYTYKQGKGASVKAVTA